MNLRSLFKLSVVLLIVAVAIVIFGSIAPSDFPRGKNVTVRKGAGLSETAALFKEAGVIRSKLFYKAYVVLEGGSKGVRSGQYLFEEPQSAIKIASRIVNGEEGYTLSKITIPEGLASPDIARLIKRSIPSFDTKAFLALAKPKEGYLFPDTYFFYENVTPADAVETMVSNFKRRMGSLTIPLKFLDVSFDEVLTMASILEEEATSTADRQIISGILWKRIDRGMLLQVDPPFFYILGKTSAELTLTDLATSSRYNTYKYLGLPPAPISNPSLDSIYAAVHPTATPYLYFLANKKGKIYYAADFEGHIANRSK